MNWRLRDTVGFFVYSTADTDILPEWKEVRFAPVIKRIVARVSNRVFVGLPLCEFLLPTTLVDLP